MMYLWLSDIYYLLRKRYLYLLIFFLLPILSTFLISFSSAGFVDSFISVLGLNIITNQYSPMEIISYLYFVFFALFLVIDFYLKDILYQLDNIFMRMSLSKWYMHKTFLFIAVMFFLKLFQYLLVVLTFLILKGPITFSVLELLQLFITDTLYTVLLQFLILFVAILSSFSKVRWLSILSILITFFFFPKSILIFERYWLVSIFFIVVLIFLILKIISKKIFERIY